MQEEQPPVCGRCGQENPGNYCSGCGERQRGRQGTSVGSRLAWALALAVAVAAVGVLTLFLIPTLANAPPQTPTPPATPTIQEIMERSTTIRQARDQCRRSGGEFEISNIRRNAEENSWEWQHQCILPIHEVVTCQEMADYWILNNYRIREITQLSVRFRGQDRMECRGWVDMESAEDEWATLSAEQDYEGNIYYFLDWD